MLRILRQRSITALIRTHRSSSGVQSPRPRAWSSGRGVVRVPPGPPRQPSGYKHFRDTNRGAPRTGPRNVGLAVALLGGTYYVAHLERAPYTGRRRMIDISRAQEIAMGDMAFAQLLEAHRGQVLPKSHPQSRRVRAVGVRIARAVKHDHPELLEGFKWRFVVIDAPGVVNAACVPGGKIVVFSGMLDAAPDDDALAAVLGHEISHAVLRHSAERLSFMKIIFAIQMLLYVIVDFAGVTNMLVQLVMNLPYSRKLEREADQVGLVLMTNACYDPAASPKMFQRLADIQEQGGAKESRATNMLSTHPMFSDRIKRLEDDVPEQQVRYGDKCSRGHSSWPKNLGPW